jgi:hypothetical protein
MADDAQRVRCFTYTRGVANWFCCNSALDLHCPGSGVRAVTGAVLLD